MIRRKNYLSVLSGCVASVALVGGAQADYTFDASVDQTWAGANWNDGTPGQFALETSGGDIGLAPTGTTYEYGSDVITIDDGSSVTSASRITIDTGSLIVDGSSLDVALTSGNLSALNTGFAGGSGASIVFNDANVSFTSSGSSGRTIQLKNDATMTITDSTVSISALGNKDWLEVKDTSVVTVTNSIINSGTVKLDGTAPSALLFESGTITLIEDNALRSSASFNGQFDWTGVAGAGSLVHTVLGSDETKHLAGRVALGMFAIDGTQIAPTTVYDGSNVAALNAELATLPVGGRYFEITDTGSQQSLALVNVPEPASLALMGLGGLAMFRGRRS